MQSNSKQYMQPSTVFEEWSEPHYIDFSGHPEVGLNNSVTNPNIRTNGQGLALFTGDLCWETQGTNDTAYTFKLNMPWLAPMPGQKAGVGFGSFSYSFLIPVRRPNVAKTYAELVGQVFGMLQIEPNPENSFFQIIDNSITMNPLQQHDFLDLPPVVFPIGKF